MRSAGGRCAAWTALAGSLSILAGAPADAGLFARRAVGVADVYGAPRPMTVTAPDGRTRAIARFSNFSSADPSDGHLTVFLGGADHDFPGGPNAELLWAPDSRAIAVTSNDGGADGGFGASILVREKKGHHWLQIDLTDSVAKLFAPHLRCMDDEAPHVGVVGWTSARRLIVAALVPMHGTCANRGDFTAYVVDVPTGQVLMELDRKAMRRRYSRMLGTWLAAPARHRRHHRHGHRQVPPASSRTNGTRS